ncbi:MAG: radical SAM protein [Saccharofermentanales bacterium]
MHKQNNLIKWVTIDPNVYCNAKCWFCINKYIESKSSILSIEKFEIIINKILKERGNLLDPDFENIIFNHNFNEILLYPYFENMLELYRKYNLKTIIFTNGTNLTPEKIDLIMNYSDVCDHIILNIPSIDKDTWISYTSLKDYDFNKLINNLNYLHSVINNNIKISNIINGLNDMSLLENGGNMSKMIKFPKFVKLDVNEQKIKFKEKYPKIITNIRNQLTDWSNFLEEKEIYSLSLGNILNIKRDNKKIIGCSCRSRIHNHLEITSNGDVFMCINGIFGDNSRYGNILEQDLFDIWNSEERKKIIEYSTTKGICTRCNAAIWGK